MHRKIADNFAARLLMLCFFLPMAVQVAAMLVAIAYFVADKFLTKYEASFEDYTWAVALSAGFYLYLFWLPFTLPAQMGELFMLAQHKLSYLLLPFFFAAISPTRRALMRGQLPWFVYGCVVCCTIANVMFLYDFYTTHADAQIGHVAYRMYVEHITGLHPTYLSMYICFSISILLGIPKPQMQPWIKYLLLYLLLVVLFSLLAKSQLLAICVIGLHYAYLKRNLLLRYKFQIAAAIAALAVALYFIPFFGQRITEVLQFAGIGRHGGGVTDNSMYVRQIIWNTDVHMLKQYWGRGVGPAMLQHLLNTRYFFQSISRQFYVGFFDPHNQYISEWLSFGLVGIIVMVFTLAIQVVTALRRADYLYLYLLIILCITFCTETILARQYGVVFYAVFTSLFFFSRQGSNAPESE